jgi:thymidylate kinase
VSASQPDAAVRTGASDQAGFPPEALPSVVALFGELHRRSVRYCHWKSTTGLPRALAGRTDLDLLVDADQADLFADVVSGSGFKRFLSHPSRRYPFVEDWLGFDAEGGRLVHLHVYQRLIVGEEYVKNHDLPLVSAFLDATEMRYGIRVPSPALELTVLILRALLKYRDTDAVKDFLRLGRRGGVPPEIRAEVDDLARRVSPEEVVNVAARHLPAIPDEVFTGFLETMSGDRRDARRLLRLRSLARGGLRGYERLPRSRARATYLAARISRAPGIRQVLGRLSRRELRRKSPLGGGLTVALLGADGSGKTTLVAAVREWLSWRVNLSMAYLGTSRPSRATAIAQSASRLARAVAGRAGHAGVAGGGTLARMADVVTAVRYLMEARDRSARVRQGRALAAQGVVVVFDRYPLSFVRQDGRFVDGPRIAQLGPQADRGLLGALRRREEATYRGIPEPDVAFLLNLPAEVAVARKAAERPEAIERKASAIQRAAASVVDAGRDDVVVVDATRPLETVIREVQSEIWRRL